MAAMPFATDGHEDAMLASQCLDFCQMLTGKSITFSFSLTTRTGFSFSVDSRGKEALASKKKKKPTPSTLKRNARRREEFLKKKFNASTEKSSQEEPAAAKEAEVPSAQCVLCSVRCPCIFLPQVFSMQILYWIQGHILGEITDLEFENH